MVNLWKPPEKLNSRLRQVRLETYWRRSTFQPLVSPLPTHLVEESPFPPKASASNTGEAAMLLESRLQSQ